MFNKRYIVLLLVFLFSIPAYSQNLASGWDGNGVTGSNSAPDDVGWESTSSLIPWNSANGNGGCRFRDHNVDGGHTGYSHESDGSPSTTRQFMLRWDHDSYRSAYYTYPVNLSANTVYQLSMDYLLGGSAPAPGVLTAGLGRSRDGTALLKTKSFPTTSSTRVYRNASMLVKSEQAGTYYITLSGTRAWYGLTNLALEEYSSNETALSEIELGIGSLDPAFDPAITTYSVVLPSGTTSVNIVANPAIEYSSVSGGGLIDVSTGGATAHIVVTALDGVTTQTYTLNFTIESIPSDARLANLLVDGGYLKGNFSGEPGNYEILVPKGVSTVTVAASTSNPNTIITSGTGDIDVSGGSTSSTIRTQTKDGQHSAEYILDFTVSEDNYMFGWDGDGFTGAGSSADKFGWQCSLISNWGEANASGGVRYIDQTYDYDDGELSGRILFVRWDGAGGTGSDSTFAYPAVLQPGYYQFSAKMALHANTNSANYHYQINTAPDNTGDTLASDVLRIPTKGVLHDMELVFEIEQAGTYFFTLDGPFSLGAIRDLHLDKADDTDTDQDGVIDLLDNCVNTANPDQADLNDNGIGDACDDIDQDKIFDALDNCPTRFNPGQLDTDFDGTGDECDPDQMIVNYLPEGTGTLTDDGTWCWFQDPRALYYEGKKKQTYTGWVTSDGSVEVASYNHESGEIRTHTLAEKFQVDDHNNPTFLVRKDGRIMASYSGHFFGPMRVQVSNNAEDISSFGPEATFGTAVTYANPYQIGDTTAMFYRDGSTWHPTINKSQDGGLSWGEPQELITRAGSQQRPYVKYTQDSKGGIHMTFTTGHPRQERANHIYYAYFINDGFYRADGTLIKRYTGSNTALDIDAGEAEVVYDASAGKGWTWDIALDENENPVILYAAFPDDLNHNYYYAHWNGKAWSNQFIVNSGRWFPQTPENSREPEPNYSGGMALDPNDPSIVYLSKQVDGVFEIFKYTTNDFGQTWSIFPITKNTEEGVLNVRPVVPRNHKPGSMDVMWMRGKYVTYQNYHTSVMYYSPGEVSE